MKLGLLLLLGLFALSANAEYYNDPSNSGLSGVTIFKEKVKRPRFFNGLADKMEKQVKELAQSNIKFLEAELHTIVNKFVAKLSSLVQYSLYSVDKMLSDTRAQFLLSDNKNSVPCFNEHRRELEHSQSSARAGVEDCTVKANLQINVVNENIKQHIDSLRKEVESIDGILKGCVSLLHPFTTSACIFNNVSNLTKCISGIVSSATDAIKTGEENLNKLVADTKSCIQSNVKVSEQRTKSAIDNIKKCIERGHNSIPTY